MTGGDYAVNVRTGECRLVIAVDNARNEVTFSGSMKWESAKYWRTHARVTVWPSEKRLRKT